jgi:hypothetical protein
MRPWGRLTWARSTEPEFGDGWRRARISTASSARVLKNASAAWANDRRMQSSRPSPRSEGFITTTGSPHDPRGHAGEPARVRVLVNVHTHRRARARPSPSRRRTGRTRGPPRSGRKGPPARGAKYAASGLMQPCEGAPLPSACWPRAPRSAPGSEQASPELVPRGGASPAWDVERSSPSLPLRARKVLRSRHDPAAQKGQFAGACAPHTTA